MWKCWRKLSRKLKRAPFAWARGIRQAGWGPGEEESGKFDQSFLQPPYNPHPHHPHHPHQPHQPHQPISVTRVSNRCGKVAGWSTALGLYSCIGDSGEGYIIPLVTTMHQLRQGREQTQEYGQQQGTRGGWTSLIKLCMFQRLSSQTEVLLKPLSPSARKLARRCSHWCR